VRQREDDIVFLERAEIAVSGFSGMDEERGGPGTGERRGNLACDDAGLAHSSDDHAAAAGDDQLHRLREALVETRDQATDRGGFGLEHLTGDGEVGGDGAVRWRDRRARKHGH
jgi:hypothetical protein